ncbi:MAG TPA: amidohydrolase family protein [Candidatus Binatia bacterium]|nr:amidohydrolase family protein [Candidatus Binatia bacterium]
MNIDLHSHFFPIDALGNPGRYGDQAPKIKLDGGRLTVTSHGGMRGNLSEGAYHAPARIKALDAMRIDLQAISPSPILLFYWADPAAAAHFSRLQNEAIQAIVKSHPDRFVGFGSVPLQNVSAAIEIAKEAKAIGLRGLEIGTSVGDKMLDDPVFEPFYEAVQALGLLLFVHPVEDGIETEDPLTGMLGNVLQFPFRTTQMIERMILKGMFEKYPNLRLCLSHGGGLLAFNIWRLDHAYGIRPEFRKNIARKPSEYLETIYFDSIVHSVAALQYLIQVAGADRVVIGTDYPMAMGDFEPVRKIEQLNLGDPERRQLLGGNAARALNL